MQISVDGLREGDGIDELIAQLKSQRKIFKVDPDEVAKQYDPKQHKVFDPQHRPDKIIKQYRGMNGAGRKATAIYEDVLSPVTRIAIPYQKLIVERLVGTMLGNKIKLTEERQDGEVKESSDLFRKVKRVWKDNKMDFTNRKILRSLLSEMEVAEIWYAIQNEYREVELKCKIVSPSLGDKLYPYFDENGSLVAFSREYQIDAENDGDMITRFDVYLKDGMISFQQESDMFTFRKATNNPLKKLPVIYYCQDLPEWNDVQEACDRQDKLVSNFADTNDYFASPMVKVKGTVEGFADKGEQGKLITVSGDGDVEYLTWDSGPEAIKTEFDNTEDLIFGSMQLPNFSWSKIKGIGNLQNAILRLFFTDPHMKAETKWEIFGIGIQRRLNLLTTAVFALMHTKESPRNIIIEPVMKPYVPENLTEIIDALTTGTAGEAVMSQERALELNPLVEDVNSEKQRLSDESAKRQTESFVINGE